MAGTKAETPDTAATPAPEDHKEEAKSRFNAALEEAKAGAAALGAEAKQRAESYQDQARAKGDHWVDDTKSKATGYANQGKAKLSEGLTCLGKLVSDNAGTVDEKLGPGYGDYVRSASKKLEDTATKLDSKSLEELGEDSREFVRTNPALSVGMAAVAGYMFARIFRSSK
ncbi:hypothetical protein [Altericroceibacterium spongiae]|uniref:hypothetical protein n=1 Tax=Altericroceibacterium spongiae TaxID=2320269 RepID=UPI00160217AF|nr:hypothetical protein [Altericroceibacterium spongiae]